MKSDELTFSCSSLGIYLADCSFFQSACHSNFLHQWIQIKKYIVKTLENAFERWVEASKRNVSRPLKSWIVNEQTTFHLQFSQARFFLSRFEITRVTLDDIRACSRVRGFSPIDNDQQIPIAADQ